MGGFPILEVAIGLAFVYLLLALICTTVIEWFSRVTGSRAANLNLGIRRMLGELESTGPLSGMGEFFGRAPSTAARLTEKLYSHPLVKNLGEPGKQPSYIPAKTFSAALLDILKRGEHDLEGETPDLHRTFQAIAPASLAPDRVAPGSQLPDAAVIEQWYEGQMDRVSGWYKRHAQTMALIAAVVVTLAANADSVQLTRRLWVDPTVRTAVAESAKQRVEELGRPLQTVEYEDPTTPKPTKPVETAGDANHLSSEEEVLLGQLLGWSHESDAIASSRKAHGDSAGWWWWLLWHGMGWTITALAVSMGAPFWFDTLNRFMNIRSAGRAPDEKRDKSSRNGGGQ